MVTENWIILTSTFVLIITWAIVHHIKARNNPQQPPLPPGPKGLPIIGNLLSLDPQLHTYFVTLAQAHGPIFSLHLGNKLAVVISSPPLAKEVLKDHDIIFSNRDVPVAGRVATYGGLNIVWSQYGPTWRLLRKLCVRELLTAATSDGICELRRREIRLMVKRLSDKVGTQVVNVGEEIFIVVMKVVTGMLWGDDVASDKKERENSLSEFRAAVKEFTSLLAAPNVSDFFNGLAQFDLQGVEKRMRKCAKWFDDIFNRIIDQHLNKKGEKKEMEFLDVCLKMMENYEGENGDQRGDDEVPFTMKHIKGLLMDLVVGGIDTTSNTIEFAMAEVMNKPEVMKKVQQELDMVVGKDNIVEEHHIYKLPYLQAVMKETLRLHPVTPLLVPHCPSESCVVGGYTIPKGSRIFVNAWAVHRDPSNWSDPNNFDPERFLNSNLNFRGNNFNYFPFGSGRRICAGITLAEKMVLYMLATLLHSFYWKMPDGEELNIQEKFGIVLSMRTPLIVIHEHKLSIK